ncbi:MAG: protein CapI, partial [Methylotenera sp.]|nr:protein CapI [Methylotenera sp.]
IEKAVGKPALINFKPMQDGDVLATFADTELLVSWTSFAPTTTLEAGLRRFVEWIKKYHQY